LDNTKYVPGTLLGDLVQAATAPRPPFWKRVLSMVGQGFIYAIVILVLATVISSATGQNTLADRVDRNAAVTATSQEALRCVLTIRPDPDRQYHETQDLINKCYAEYDQLVKELEDES
jgi:hypothetical protein